MAKKKRASSKQSKESIVKAAEALVRRKGATGITVDQVAKEAGCAKGLVHYHFKTKRGVLEAVAQQLASERQSAWAEAFRAADAAEAIDRTWGLLTAESDDGTTRAWGSLFGTAAVLPDEAVSQAQANFASTLGNSADALLRDLALVARIPPAEIGWLLGAVVHGMGFQILGGGDRQELEGSYAAAWLGILSLAT
jgi:AcrR family transcriptional regulator